VVEKLRMAYKNISIKSMSVSSTPGQGTKLRTYAKIKNSVYMEQYLLDNRLTWKQKRTLAKFRLGDHRLKIETGRHCRPKLPPEERICTVCKSSKVEDEVHFIIECPKYDLLRNKYNIRIASPDQNTFVSLMTANNYQDWKNLAGYLEEAFEVRECSDT
jgi:hypothetical protein